MNKDDITLGDLERLGMLNKPLIINYHLLSYNTYSEFIQIIYNALDFIIQKIEESRQYYYNLDEDQITINIINMLICMGFDASHDTAVGGHCDVLIKGKPAYSHLWIGEAKIHGAYKWLWDGFLQLDRRYSVGRENSCHGAMIIYCNVARIDNVMQSWKDHMRTQTDYDFSFSNCDILINGFDSSHTHHRTGQKFMTKHIPISIHFKPIK